MGINVDWTPSSAAPALYGAALGAGQEQFRNRRQQELMQLAELDQRQQALQANLYNQQQNRILDAQQAAQDRAFRAQAMQFGAAQDIFQQQQHFLQQQELEQDNWFNQQEESGALIRDAASRMKLQKFYAQQGAIRSAPNLTLQDKQMKLMELQDQIRAERRGGLREPLPGERQKSMQEKWQESSIKVNGPNGEIMYVSPDRSGAFREVGRFEPPTTTASRQREVEPVITVRTIDPNTGKPVVSQAAKTFEEIQEERRIQEQIAAMPTLTEIEELHKVPVGFQFKGPDGLFFERDDTPQGYHQIDDPRKAVYDSVQARAADMAAEQARLLKEAVDRQKQEAALQKAAERRQTHLDDIKKMTVKEMVGTGVTAKEKERPLTPDEMLEELERREAFDKLLEERLNPQRDERGQRTFGPAPTPPDANVLIDQLEQNARSNAGGAKDVAQHLMRAYPQTIPIFQSANELVDRHGGLKESEAKIILGKLRAAVRTPELPIPSEAGNIDLSNRPVVRNEDGTISTVRSISISTPRGVYLIPTVSDDGRIMPDQEAVATFQKSGRHLGRFKNEREADAYAEQLHQQQARAYGNPNMPPLPPVPQPSTQAEYDALPSGSLYRFTDGRIMRKP